MKHLTMQQTTLLSDGLYRNKRLTPFIFFMFYCVYNIQYTLKIYKIFSQNVLTTLEIHVIIRYKLNQENTMRGSNTMIKTARELLIQNGFETTDNNVFTLYILNETVIFNGDNIIFKSIDRTVYAPTEEDKIDFVLNFIMSSYTTCFLA